MLLFSRELFGLSHGNSPLCMDGRGRTIDRRREFEAEARHELFRENRLRKPREEDLRLASVFFLGKGREAAQKLATSLPPFGKQKKKLA